MLVKWLLSTNNAGGGLLASNISSQNSKKLGGNTKGNGSNVFQKWADFQARLNLLWFCTINISYNSYLCTLAQLQALVLQIMHPRYFLGSLILWFITIQDLKDKGF